MSLKYEEVLNKLANNVVEDIGMEKVASDEELLKEASEVGMEIMEKVAEYNETSIEDVEEFVYKIAEELGDIENLKQAAVEIYDEYADTENGLESAVESINEREEHVANLLDEAGFEKVAGAKADKVMELLRAMQAKASQAGSKVKSAITPDSKSKVDRIKETLKKMINKETTSRSVADQLKNPYVAGSGLVGGAAGAIGANIINKKTASFDEEIMEKVAEYNETSIEDVEDFLNKLAEEIEDVDILKVAALELAEEFDGVQQALSETCDVIESREEHVASLLNEAGFEKIAGVKVKAVMDALKNLPGKVKDFSSKAKNSIKDPLKSKKINKAYEDYAGKIKDPSKLMGALKSPYARYGGTALAAGGAGYTAGKMKKNAAEAIRKNEMMKQAADEKTLEILAELEANGIDPERFVEEI